MPQNSWRSWLRTIGRRALPLGLRRIVVRLAGTQASHGYHLIDRAQITAQLAAAWQDESIPRKQRVFADVDLAQMREGPIPRQLSVAAEAIRQTHDLPSRIIEIGCASGYYFEALEYLLTQKIEYLGLDYSLPLLEQAYSLYPQTPFVNGDATRLPFADDSWEIVLSGCVLLHVPDWKAAVAETARIAKAWCIFHRTPICDGPTRLTSKLAYHIKVIEWHFNERELIDLISDNGLELISTLPISEGDSVAGLAGKVSSVTYLFHKASDRPQFKLAG